MPASHLAYSRVSVGLCTEQGPITSTNLLSLPLRTLPISHLPLRTVCIDSSPTGISNLSCSGEGKGMIRRILEFVNPNDGVVSIKSRYKLFQRPTFFQKLSHLVQQRVAKCEGSPQQFHVLDAVRGASKACDQNVYSYVAGANERATKKCANTRNCEKRNELVRSSFLISLF